MQVMKPFRKNVAIAIDGGGMRGLIVTQALAVLEDALGAPAHDIFRLAVGTSTGSIISAGIAAGMSAKQMVGLYTEMGDVIFPAKLRKLLFPLTSYRYSSKPLEGALEKHFGDMKMGELWQREKRTDLVITAYDLMTNKTIFLKPWKESSANWTIAKAVQASCTVPTYFPIVDDRYIDGGVGSYGNPCYIAAYEAKECLNWDPSETTLISIGTGRDPYTFEADKPQRLHAWEWIGRVLDVFSQSAYDQQVHLVHTYFHRLDFRRFQINLRAPIAMDDTRQVDLMVAYGTRLGRMMLHDKTDASMGIIIKHPGYF
jgi:hypothetical protein